MLRGSRIVARVLTREIHSGFGAIPGPSGMVQTVSDVKDLLATWDPRVAELNTQSHGVDGIGDDFETDLAALNGRYNAAATAARKVVSDASWLPGQEPAQGTYDAILGALKRVSGTITKGDYDDLIERLAQARTANGLQTTVTTVQPTTQDVGTDFYKATSGWDPVSWLTGDQRPPWAPDPADPLGKLEWLVLLASLGLGGMFAVRLVLAPAAKAAFGLVATIVGGTLVYRGTKAAGAQLAKISIAGKLGA